MKSFAILLWACVMLAAAAAHGAELPNIVFILADDLGYGDLRAYNPRSKIETPSLDRLAADGMRFTDAHAAGSTCVPSRYGLLTGRYPIRASLAVREGPAIEEGRVTIASLLRDNGYATAMVGKWHEGFDPAVETAEIGLDASEPLRGGPMDRGFDHFFGMHASLDIPPYFYIRGRQPTAPLSGRIHAGSSEGGDEGWNRIQGAFWREGAIAEDFKMEEVTPKLVAEAVQVIEAHAAAHTGAPLFLYLALPSPHTPWLPLPQYRGESGAGMYGDFVMQVDDAVGLVLKVLDRAEMAGETAVFFSSDNGPVWYPKDIERFGHEACGPLRGMKGDSWDGGHRVPFIVRWPGVVAPGSVSDRLICFTDVLATLAEMAGVPSLPEGAGEDSYSFHAELAGAAGTANPVPPRPPVIHNDKTIRDGKWKLITHLGSGGFSEPRNVKPEKGSRLAGQLYDLEEDLSETTNLYLEYPEVVERLAKVLADARAK